MPKKKEELESSQLKTSSEHQSDSTKSSHHERNDEISSAGSHKVTKNETIDEAVIAEEPKATTEEVPTTLSTEQPKRKKLTSAQIKSLVIKIVAGLVAVLAVVIIVFGVLIYGYKSENQAVKFVAGIIPYPVERIDGRYVSYSDYLFEVDANKRAYQNNAKLNNQPAVDYNSSDGKKMVHQIKQHALDKLKSDTVLAKIAADKKVVVSDKDVNKLLNDLYKKYGGKDTLLKTLNQIYGWDINDLKKVVRKQLLAQKLQEKIVSDPSLQTQAKNKAQDVLNKVKAGEDFGDLAKKYSQSSDASTGGDLGTITKGQLPDDIQKAVDALQPGQVSDLVKTSYGYEIIKVNDKSADSTHAQHIVINTIDFNTYLAQEVKKAKVNTYVKI